MKTAATYTALETITDLYCVSILTNYATLLLAASFIQAGPQTIIIAKYLIILKMC